MTDFIAQCMAPMGLCQIDRLYRIADSEYDRLYRIDDSEYDLLPHNPNKVELEIMEQCLAEMAEAACRIGDWIG